MHSELEEIIAEFAPRFSFQGAITMIQNSRINLTLMSLCMHDMKVPA